MHTLIARLFEKRKIEGLDKLSQEEKETFDRWERVLSEGEISVEKIANFCKLQIKNIETQWRNVDNSLQKNERLVILHTVYSLILEAISAPQKEKEQLEKHLQQMI